MKSRIAWAAVVGFMFQSFCMAREPVQPQRKQLGRAKASIDSGGLEVTTGLVSRTWKWTGSGWATVSLRDEKDDVEYAGEPAHACDWDLPGAIDDERKAELVSAEIAESDDEGFTLNHLQVVSTIRYPQSHLEVRHVVWVYPDAPGIRTQLRVKAMEGYDPSAGLRVADEEYIHYGGNLFRPGARTEYLPLDLAKPNKRRYWGYYGDPGNRHPTSKPMLKEQVVTGFPVFRPDEHIDWASGAAIEYGDRGVAVVKESPETVNIPSHLTGAFFANSQGLKVTGWGLGPDEIVTDRFRNCWATWTVVYSGGNDGLQMAVKRFDAARYPVFPKRDMFILSNTWGPGDPGGARFANEDYVLKEIPAVGELGIDVMQIDDGWQRKGRGSRATLFRPKYSNGWKDVKAAADKAGVRMGLWVAIQQANPENLKKNLDELGYITWKIDYDHLNSRGDFEKRLAMYRDIMKHSWMNTQFTLCPEYMDPRYGWYFAREFGSIYFQNVKEATPIHLTMVPYQVLRNHWEMAKYLPTNKIQVMLQNPKRVRTDISDAREHSHQYCFAMGLPFVPQFFQSAQFLDEAGKKELTELIEVYKKHRLDIFTSTTFPIGDAPDNASWSGFQMVSTQRKGGHILLFRELHNSEPRHTVRLKFLAGCKIAITNVMTGASRTAEAASDGGVEFVIDKPADFRLLHYDVVSR